MPPKVPKPPFSLLHQVASDLSIYFSWALEVSMRTSFCLRLPSSLFNQSVFSLSLFACLCLSVSLSLCVCVSVPGSFIF